MKTWVRKTLSVGVLAAGALLVASTAAQADVNQNSWDNNGVANGIQVVSGLSVPVNLVGNAIGVAGEANAAGSGVNWTEGHRKVTQNTKDNNGVLNGLQAYAPVWVPVNAVGNSVAVLGEANAAGSGVNKRTESGQVTETKHGHGDGDGVAQNSWDNNGLLNGLQVYAPVDIPINLCGNSIALLGEANAAAQCWNGHGGRKTEKAEQNSSDNNGIANGVQLLSGLHMPINLSGNAIALAGEANAAAVSHNESTHGDGITQNSSDNNGIANGLQAYAPIDIPINACGNALGILGEANAAAQCSNGDSDGNGGHGHHHGGNNGGNNGNDDDYADDNGNYGNDDDVAGNNGSNDDDDTSFGSDSASDGGRTAHKVHGKSATEASPVAGLAEGLTQGGNVPSVAGLNLLKTLG
jgi:hypothetical protein